MPTLLLLAVLVSVGVWGLLVAVGYRRMFNEGVLPRILPFAMLLAPVLEIATSDRDFGLSWAELQLQAQYASDPPFLVGVVGRMMTGLLLVGSVEALLHAARSPERIRGFRVLLIGAYVLFWLSNVASPSLLGANGSLEHDYLYTLVLGLAVLVMTRAEVDVFLRSSRDALVLLVAVSLAFVAIRPGVVLDFSYAKGFLPGVPRFPGLLSHPVTMGGMALTGIICLWAKPFQRHILTLFGAAVLLVGLVLAQGKASWVTLPLCAAVLTAFGAPGGIADLSQVRLDRVTYGLVTSSAGVALLFLGLSFWAPEGGQATPSGAVEGVTTLTGRTEIWRISYEEWARHPIFGYGIDLFDEEYRYRAEADHLTSGHNQLVDSAARAGTVGALGFLLYLGVCGWGGIAAATASAGLSLALFLLLLLWSITEAPFGLAGYGPVTTLQFLLLAVIGSGWTSGGSTRETSGRSYAAPGGSEPRSQGLQPDPRPL